MICDVTSDDEMFLPWMIWRNAYQIVIIINLFDANVDIEKDGTSIENPVSLLEAFTALKTAHRFVILELVWKL